jgi:ParB family chromosome partitioning protein
MRHDAHYVDSLTRRFEQHVGKYVPIDLLSPNPDQPRTLLGDLEELKASILTKGILEPIIVRPMPGDIGRYQVISGERRFHAALEAGLEEVPVIEIEAGDAEALEIALIENLQRKDLSAFEEADGYGTLVDRFGYTQEKVADLIGKSRSSVAELLRIRFLPAEIRELCRTHGIEAKSMLVEISRLDSPEQMARMIEAIAAGEVDRAGLRAFKKGSEGPNGGSDGTERPKPFVFKFHPKGSDFRFQIAFRKSEVSKEELISTLEGVLDELKRRTEIVSSNAQGSTAGVDEES